MDETQGIFPYPDYQWIEDRFWIWIHYAALKIGRGEYFEALDFLGFLRMVVLGPLLHIKNGNLPRGVRKAETQFQAEDLESLKSTIALHNVVEIIKAAENSVTLYKNLRDSLFSKEVKLQARTEEKVLDYLKKIKQETSYEA